MAKAFQVLEDVHCTPCQTHFDWTDKVALQVAASLVFNSGDHM